MMLVRTLLVAGAASCLMPLGAMACTTMTHTLSSHSYNPYDVAPTAIGFSATSVPNAGPPGTEPRNFHFIKARYGTEPSGIVWDVNYTSVSSGNPAKATLSGFDPRIFLGGAAGFGPPVDFAYAQGATGTVTASGTITIPAGQSLAAGTYNLRFILDDFFISSPSLGCPYAASTTDSRLVRNETPYSFDIIVPEVFQMNLKGGGVGGTMDFGTAMATGAQETVTLTLNANAPFRVTMDSDYDGVLKLGDNPLATDEVAYTATLNGTAINDATPYDDLTADGTGLIDADLDFVITLGDTTTQRAGLYKDTVTLTVQAVP